MLAFQQKLKVLNNLAKKIPVDQKVNIIATIVAKEPPVKKGKPQRKIVENSEPTVSKIKNTINLEDTEINLSDLEDQDQKDKILELDEQIKNSSLTRGERRRIQNKRNVLRAKIKKDLENDSHLATIEKLQKKVLDQKKKLDKAHYYQLQRDALKKSAIALRKQLKASRARVMRYKD